MVGGGLILTLLLTEELEWMIKRTRKKKGNKIGSRNGVRRGVWHPLSCLLKASFFPLLPPPLSVDHRYFWRLHSAATYLAVLLKGSQKLKLWALISLSRLFQRDSKVRMCAHEHMQCSFTQKSLEEQTERRVGNNKYFFSKQKSKWVHLLLCNYWWKTWFALKSSFSVC